MIPQLFRKVLRQHRLRWRFPRSVIHSDVLIDDGSKLGDHSVLFRRVELLNSEIGAYTYTQENTCLYNADVGPFGSIAKNVTVGLVNHPTSFVSTSPVFYDNSQPLPYAFVHGNKYRTQMPRTIIGADVWIGEGAKICAGVKIGVGAVIGAGAIVTRDVPPYSVVTGVPGRIIKRRFDDALCSRLVASNWWELDNSKLLRFAHSFSDPLLFLSLLETENNE